VVFKRRGSGALAGASLPIASTKPAWHRCTEEMSARLGTTAPATWTSPRKDLSRHPPKTDLSRHPPKTKKQVYLSGAGRRGSGIRCHSTSSRSSGGSVADTTVMCHL